MFNNNSSMCCMAVAIFVLNETQPSSAENYRENGTTEQ